MTVLVKVEVRPSLSVAVPTADCGIAGNDVISFAAASRTIPSQLLFQQQKPDGGFCAQGSGDEARALLHTDLDCKRSYRGSG